VARAVGVEGCARCVVSIAVGLDGKARIGVGEVDAVRADAMLDLWCREAGAAEHAQQARLENALRYASAARVEQPPDQPDTGFRPQLMEATAHALRRDETTSKGVV